MKTPGNKCYNIEYLDSVVEEDIPSLPKTAYNRIKKAIEERLTLDPLKFGEPLRYNLKGYRRLRVGDYRVIYQIDTKRSIVNIVAILHRKIVYEQFNAWVLALERKQSFH